MQTIDGQHLGQYRVSLKWAPCGNITIISQQVENNEGQRTFRKWNPKKTNVPFGQETSADADETCSDCYCCAICKLVNWFMNSVFEEVVDFTEEGHRASADMFKSNDEAMKSAGNIIRPCSIVACIFGFYLLFSPIIALLSWIPLVGSLLGMVVALAAMIFAVVVGTTVASLVLGLAWLFFRPLIGVSLLVVTAGGIACIWLIPTGDVDSSQVGV